jgi:hypothetical protein
VEEEDRSTATAPLAWLRPSSSCSIAVSMHWNGVRWARWCVGFECVCVHGDDGGGLGLADDEGKIAVCFQAIVKAQTDSTPPELQNLV